MIALATAVKEPFCQLIYFHKFNILECVLKNHKVKKDILQDLVIIDSISTFYKLRIY